MKDVFNLTNFLYAQAVPIVIIVGGILMQFVKPNLLVGFRTFTTLSDPEIWSKSNKVTGLLLIFSGILFFIINLIVFLTGWIVWFKYFYPLIIICLLIITFYGIIYSNKLKREKGEFKPFIISKTLVYFFFFIMLLSIITGILLLFLPQNYFIGVRIGKTLSDPSIWRKVNTISGIGFIIIGVLFAPLFYKIANLDEKQRTKIFVKYTTISITLIIVWTLFSILIAYYV